MNLERRLQCQVLFVVTRIDLRCGPDHTVITWLWNTHLLPQKKELFCSSFSRGWFVWNLGFPYSMLIGLPVAWPGILFLAANLNMHLRFLFNLLKYDCDNFISTACTAPLVFERQSAWLWLSGTWPWERHRLLMSWKPSLSGRCVHLPDVREHVHVCGMAL